MKRSYLAEPDSSTFDGSRRTRALQWIYGSVALALLFANYFIAQYDKFILSYFMTELVADLNLSSSSYGLLSGYATGIVYALLAIPLAYLADVSVQRVWVLTACTLWWNVCVICQGLSHHFWQIMLARIGMGIGQSAVEAISISLISDLLPRRWVLLGERYDASSKKSSKPVVEAVVDVCVSDETISG